MAYKHQSQQNTDEHISLTDADGNKTGAKKVVVLDDDLNLITSFSAPTVTLLPYSFYQNVSLVSGYKFYGLTVPGNNPTTTTFRIQREVNTTGEVLYGDGSPQFIHQWSSASMPSIDYA